jgi:hypothetical protein
MTKGQTSDSFAHASEVGLVCVDAARHFSWSLRDAEQEPTLRLNVHKTRCPAHEPNFDFSLRCPIARNVTAQTGLLLRVHAGHWKPNSTTKSRAPMPRRFTGGSRDRTFTESELAQGVLRQTLES